MIEFSQELILLGLLKEGPKHGYEIKRRINQMHALFAGVKISSIYYPLSVLEKRGLVSKKNVQAGRRPLRLVYNLTEKGKRRFEDLLTKSFLDFRRPQFSLDLSLYFLDYIKPIILRRKLRARLIILKKLLKDIKKLKASLKKKKPSLELILEHDLKMVHAEVEFLSHLIEKIIPK